MRNLSYLLISTVLVSCASTVNILKLEGDAVTLTLTDASAIRVELLAVTDSRLIAKHDGKIKQAPLAEVMNIHIHDYRIDPAIKILWAIPPVLLEGIIMLVAFDVEQPLWGVIAGLAMVGTIYGFSTGDPKTTFASPFTDGDLENLRLYCRYPQNLTDVEWKNLLEHFQQDDFIKLP
ncbi:hypothetical protein JW998_10650 [candidate division KSB1 bacterium]|nr:hypothetical protein [candidate division KSB1 bacterium]